VLAWRPAEQEPRSLAILRRAIRAHSRIARERGLSQACRTKGYTVKGGGHTDNYRLFYPGTCPRDGGKLIA
jgi:hypothetical protein